MRSARLTQSLKGRRNGQKKRLSAATGTPVKGASLPNSMSPPDFSPLDAGKGDSLHPPSRRLRGPRYGISSRAPQSPTQQLTRFRIHKTIDNLTTIDAMAVYAQISNIPPLLLCDTGST